MNRSSRSFAGTAWLVLILAFVAGAHAATLTVNGTLTHSPSSSSCSYTSMTEDSAGRWSVTCGAGTRSITINPRLCGSMCTSYSALSADGLGNWTVSDCVPAISADVLMTQPSGAVANHPLGTPLTLAATATACAGSIGSTSIVKVEFFANDTLIPGCTVSTPISGSTYQCSWTPNGGEGNYSVVAKATNSVRIVTPSQTVNVYVNAPPTATISASPAGPLAAPAKFVLTGSGSDTSGISRIEFYSGSTLLGTVNGASGAFAWNNVAAGTYSVKARAYDIPGLSGDSAPITLTVTSTNNAPTITAAPTATPSGTTFNLNVGAADSDGNIARVDYVDNVTQQVVATWLPNSGQAAYIATWSNPSNGSHTFYARVTDNSGGVATSGTTTFTVVEPFRVTLASTPVSTPYYVGPAATMKFTLVPYPAPFVMSQVTLFMDDAAQPGGFTAGSIPGEWEKTISVASGTHRFYARVVATDGSSGASNEHLVSIDAGTQPAAAYVCAAEQTNGIGATAGVASVSDSGASSYSIPIQVPPGIAGVAPSLSLAYNSQGGNGLAGVGWALQGFSMIQRCPKNVFIDTTKGEITYGASDPLCLDGQRLIPVGGDRNATGEYRTERESYSRIQSFRVLPADVWAGPEYFKVWTKSGQILYYGRSQQAPYETDYLRTLPVATAGETGRVWALYRIEDRFGNYARIVYENNQDAGTIRPSYIEYTGNSTMGTAPFARVTFTYEARTDAANMYLGGQVSFETKRLKAIDTVTDISPTNPNGVSVKSYRLAYADSLLSKRPLLQSVQECSGDGVMCLNPTSFGWTDTEGGGHTFAIGSWFGTTSYNNRFTTVAVDMDGDGKTDFVNRIDNDHTWDVCRSTGTGFSCSPWTTVPRAQGVSRDDIWYFADFTGDGKADVVFFDSSLRPTLQPNIGGQFGPPVPTSQQLQWNGIANPSAHPYARAIGDFNGDGRIDLALYNGNERWIFCEYNGSAFVCSGEIEVKGAPQPDGSPDAGFDFLVGDFNGDGRADIAFHRNNAPLDQPGWRVCHSISQNGSFAFDCYTNPATNNMVVGIYENAYKVHVADMNGDGLADLVSRDTTVAGRWRVCLSKGDKTFDCSIWDGGPNVTRDNATLGDFNGDGRTDILWWQPTAPVGWRVCESTGAGFNCGTLWTAGGTAPSDNLENVRTGDFNGDGKTDIAIWGSGDTTLWSVGLAGGSPTDVVRRITNGLGIASVFTYKPLTDATVYTKGTSAVYPAIDIQSPMLVVSRMETSTLAANPWYGIDYSYRGLKGHALGAGVAGFEGRIVVDSNTDNPNVKMCSETVTFTFWDDRRIGLPLQASKRYGPAVGVGSCSGGIALSQVTNTWESRKSNTFNGLSAGYSPPSQALPIWEVFLTGSTETKADLNGAQLPTSQMSSPMSSIDALGNPTSVSAASWRISPSVDSFTKSTTSAYYNDVGPRWIVGKVTRVSVTNGVPYTPVNANNTRVSLFGYSTVDGSLGLESIEPDRPNSGSEHLDTTYGYDGFGNRNSVGYNGLGVSNRWANTVYCVNGQSGPSCQQDGRFPTYSFNAAGHTESKRFDSRFGTVTQATNPNGLTTFSSFDRMSRKFCETRPDGSSAGWTWRTDSDVSGASYFMVTKDSSTAASDPGGLTAGQASQQHLDALNRELAVRTRAFDGRWSIATSGYDYRGRKTVATKPYADTQGGWIYGFDDLNRLTSEQGPAGYSATHVYNGVSVSTTVAAQVLGQPGTQTTTRTTNNRGEIVAVLDARSSTLNLQYDAFGNLEKKTVTPGSDGGSGATTTISYDVRGRKIGMSDPDQGSWTYGYNAASEITLQIDGNNNTTTFAYDNMGRMFRRTLSGIDTVWTYDSNGGPCGQASVGKLCRVADNKTSRDFSYDNQSRPVRTRFALFDGRWFERFTSYDSMSRVRQVVYPFTGFTLAHTYNANGFLQRIEEQRPIGFGTNPTWTANSRYLDGQINTDSIRSTAISRTYDALGRVNGINTPNVQFSTFSYDPVGNLLSRADSVTHISETFTYDALNRLKSVTGPASRTFKYDSLGNLTSRSDIAGDLQYRPGTHQLSQVASVGYHYDNGGNLTYLDDSSRVVAYWPNGKASSVTTNATLPSQGYSYEYDTEFQRAIEYQVTGNGGSTGTEYATNRITTKVQSAIEFPVSGNSASSKTDYFSDGITPFFEEEFNQDAAGNRSIAWKHYVNTPEGVNQLVVIRNDATSSRADRPFVRDHLGSTVVVGGDGISEYQSFDEWGGRRSVMGSPNPPTKTDRGFTGHEMMDMVGLINMNGRLYDPVVGRMMQADPLVQAPLNLQSYNRYSYVMNNPLSLTDPTGYSWWTDKGRPAFRFVGAIVASWFIGPGGYYGVAGAFGNSVVSGAAAGFAAGGIQGGNLNSALAGAVSGGVFGGISTLAISNWSKIGLAATAGGVMSRAMGGDFRSGFISTGLNSFVDLELGSFDKPIHQAVFKGLTGGIGARLAGGSFRNGALTSSISSIISGTLGPGSAYTEQYPDDYTAYQQLGPGRAMMGVRPLDHWLIHMLGDPMFLPSVGGLLEGTTFKLAHEAVFFRDSNNIADDQGYSPNGALHEGQWVRDANGNESKQNNMPTSSFRFNPRTFGVPFEIDVGVALPGYETGASYRFLGRNCQCFARAFRYLGGP